MATSPRNSPARGPGPAIIFMALAICSANAERNAAKPPMAPFPDLLSVEDHRRNAAMIENCDDAELRNVFVTEKRTDTARAAAYEKAALSAAALWKTTGETRYRDLAIKACRAALGRLADEPEDFFRRQVSEKGSIERRNLYQQELLSPTDLYALRDACEHFAMLYDLTGEQSCARKSAILLARFAEEIPKWPIYYPNGSDEKTVKTIHAQSGPNFFGGEDAPGLWGIWIYQDLDMGYPLAHAYELIYPSGELQRFNALEAVRRMLRCHLDLQERFGTTDYSNMNATQWHGILRFARILNDPEYFHRAVRWLQDFYKSSFYSDGWWHESTTSYHKHLHGRCKDVARELLQGYSDPPGFVSPSDGTHYDNLDILKIMERPFARADAVLADMRLPDGTIQVLGDSHFRPQKRAAPDPDQLAKSQVYGARGHAILGTGRGADMVQVSLHLGGTHGHEHYDGLNLNLFAKGRELISETQYSVWEGTNSTREWHTMTAGHATVVVDGLNQPWRLDPHTPKRQRQPEDDIPNIPDWPWRWFGHGDVMNDGRLRLFNSEFENVQVMEADAERRYGSLIPLERYRRTIALVKISEKDAYVVDIFRIKGGKTHDYMLHSCLDILHDVKLSVLLPDKDPDPLHKYITGVRRGETGGPWSADFRMDDRSANLQTRMLGAPGTELLLGEAPAMRRFGTAPFLAVRRSGPDTVYIAVHHPYAEKPLVKDVQAIAIEPSDDQAVALRITLPDRIDTIISTSDKAPWPVRRTNGVALRGRFAHVAEGREGWAYLIDGDFLEAGGRRIEKNVSYEGLLTRASRIEKGEATDAFFTETPLPDDGSLNGRIMMVDLGGLLVQSFRIARVERRGSETAIHSADEPGMTITPGLIKMEYFPGWGIKGDAHFRIAGSAVLRD